MFRARCRARAIPAALTSFVALAGCASVDHVDDRAMAMQESVARYADEAALFNLVRVMKGEPIHFASMGEVQGHDTQSLALGLPTFTMGWHAQNQPRTFSFGPNTATRSLGSDFSLEMIDDPATFQALMTPLNPATFGFLQDQGADPALLMHLFFNSVRYGRSGPAAGVSAAQTPQTYWGEMTSGTFVFDQSLDDLLQRRLTVQIDFTSPPSAGAGLWNLRYRTCEASSNGAWVCGDSSPAGAATPTAAGQTSPNPPQYVWSVPSTVDSRGVDISLRSTLGVYKLVADIARPERTDRPKWAAGIRVTHARSGCAIRIVYEKQPWCVPEDSRKTLLIIGMLHQLLLINSSALERGEGATPTVRVTGGGGSTM
jgi:hypothetical protein